jgi:hypothetical protein
MFFNRLQRSFPPVPDSIFCSNTIYRIFCFYSILIVFNIPGRIHSNGDAHFPLTWLSGRPRSTFQPGPTMTDLSTTSTEEYELLTAKQKERERNTETATVEGVRVTRAQVNLSLTFDWTADSTRLVYDLDDERDVRKLEALADEHGFEFAQVGHLEGLSIPVRYTSRGWVPTTYLAYTEGEGTLSETVRTELELFGREIARTPGSLDRFVAWVKSPHHETARYRRHHPQETADSRHPRRDGAVVTPG